MRQGECVLIAASVDVRLASSLLGTHVRRCADGESGLRERLPSGGADGARDAEIGDDRMSVVDEDILRLDVAMHEAASMRVASASANSVAMRKLSSSGSCFSRLRRLRSVSPSTYGMT